MSCSETDYEKEACMSKGTGAEREEVSVVSSCKLLRPDCSRLRQYSRISI